jgi:hypothetical protein
VLAQWIDLKKEIAAQQGWSEDEKTELTTNMAVVESYLMTPDAKSEDAQAKLIELHKTIAKKSTILFRTAQDDAPTRQEHAAPTAQQRATRITREKFFTSMLSNAIIAIVAALGGLIILYFPSNIWGNLQDFVVAFLWGFGLNATVNNAEFKQGAASYLGNRFSGKSTD